MHVFKKSIIFASINTLKKVLPYVLYASIILIIFYPAILLQPGTYMFGWDTMDQLYYVQSFFSNQIQHGVFPFWNPHVFGGYPYAASLEAEVFYPFTYLYALFPIPVASAWIYIIHIYIAAIGMFILCRKWFSYLPAFGAGLVYAFSGFFVPRVLAGSSGMIIGSAYTPLILAAFIHCLDKKSYRTSFRNSLGLCILTTLQMFGGDIRSIYYTWLIVGMYCFIHIVFYKSIKSVLLFAYSVVVTILLSAIQLLPMYQLVTHTVRGNQPYEWASNGALTLVSLLQMFPPILWNYYPNSEAYMPFIESPWYIGILPFILVCIGILFGIRHIFQKIKINFKVNIVIYLFFLISILLSLWMALGNNAPFDLFHFFWKFIPGFKFIRMPIKIFTVFVFGCAGISAYTIYHFRRSIVQFVIVFFVGVELIIFCRPYVLIRPTPEKSHDLEMLFVFKNDPSGVRIHPNYYYFERLGSSWDFNAPDFYNLYSTNGYSSAILANYADFYQTAYSEVNKDEIASRNQLPPLYDFYYSQGLDLLNVGYVITREDAPLDEPHYSLLVENPSNYFRLYKNNFAMPRFFLVRKAIFTKDDNSIRDAISKQSINLSDTVLLSSVETNHTEGSTSCITDLPGDIVVKSYESTKIVLDINSNCDTYLFSSEVMYPGWKATIDGKPTPIYTGNLAFRTIQVAEGVHTVVFWYDPWIYTIGGSISITTLFILLFLNIVIKRKSNIHITNVQ